MANAIWQRNIVDETGNILPGATVAVYDTEGGSLVNLFDSSGSGITNPVVADLNGYAFFYAAPGKYYLRVAFGANSTPYPDVLVGTTADDGVGTIKIVDGNVTTGKIADDAVTEPKLATGSVSRRAASSDIVTQVADIAELRALTGAVDGQVVKVTDTPRKGSWEWDSSDLSAEVAADPYSPVTGVGGIEYMPLDGGDGSSGAFRRVIKGARYYAGWAGATPYDSGSPEDAQPGLQYFFDYFASTQGITLVWDGEWGIESTVTISSIDCEYVSGHLICLAAMDEALILDTEESRHRGAVRVTGTGGNDYSTRTVKTLVAMARSLRSDFTGGFVVSNALRWGIATESQQHPGGLNAIDVGYGRVRALNCGSAGDRDEDNAWSVRFSYTGRTDTGPSVSFAQRTEMSGVSGMPDELEVGDIIRVGTGFYDVTDVDHVADTLEVYPWIAIPDLVGSDAPSRYDFDVTPVTFTVSLDGNDQSITLNTALTDLGGLIAELNAQLDSTITAIADGLVVRLYEVGPTFSGGNITVSGTTADVFGVSPASDNYSDVFSCHGGAVYFDGSNAADSKFDAINALRCGHGLAASALYGPVVNNLQTQVTAVSVSQRGLNYGFTVNGFHPETPEGTGVDFLKLDTVDSSTNISGLSVLRWGDIKNLIARSSDGSLKDASFRELIGVTFHDGQGHQYFTGSDPYDAAGIANITISNKQCDNLRYSNRNAATTLNVSYDEDADRLFGAKIASFYRCGFGATGGASGDITIQPTSEDSAAGITVMGAASYVVTANATNAVRIDLMFDYRQQDWRVIE